MSKETRPGFPGFGVEDYQQPPAKPEKPLKNKPDWNEYMNPERQRREAERPRRPTETDTPPPSPPKKGKKVNG